MFVKPVFSHQLDRKPSKCVVFEDDPRGVTAAHNCTMMAVALIGAHPAYVVLSFIFSFLE
jgi:beta-phosphoglucomutase-like phosphatase (HAD superfamily)